MMKYMEISKYINWPQIWDEEVCLQTSMDILDDGDENITIIQQFIDDGEVQLESDECFLNNDGTMVFFFGETGGQNESDNQGWGREYMFTVDENFFIISAEYSQG